MVFDALGAHEFEAGHLGAEVGYWLFFMFVAGDVVCEVGLHVLEGECSLHIVHIGLLFNMKLLLTAIDNYGLKIS